MAEFKVALDKSTPYDAMAKATEEKYGLPEGLLKTTLLIENRNNIQNRVSPKGARGIAQIMPATARGLGYTEQDANDPVKSIEMMGKLYSELNQTYNGDVGAMMAHYNGGNKAGKAYMEGKSLNPETADYIKYATPYLEATGKPSKYQTQLEGAVDVTLGGDAPSDHAIFNETDGDNFADDLSAKFEQQLQEEERFFNLSLADAAKQGFRSTMTDAIAHAYSREDDVDFNMNQSHYDRIQREFPGGLDEASTDRLYNSRSESDFEYNLGRLRDSQNFARTLGFQTGLDKFGGYAATFAGGLADPVALPAGTFGLAGRVIKGGSIAAGAGRMAVEGAAGAAIVSPVTQLVEKNHISGEELLENMAAGAVMSTAIGGILSRVGRPKGWQEAVDASVTGRVDGNPDFVGPQRPRPADTEGDAVDFRNATDTSVTDDGAISGVGPTAVKRAAADWDESPAIGTEAIQARRKAYYGSKWRDKVFGWSDSEGVRLATSDHKVARFVGAMWAGNSGAVGKVEARTAATLKDQLKEQLDFTYIPTMKEIYEGHLTPGQKYDYMAGGAKDAQQAFSREVQLERYRHREYRVQNENSSKGYESTAPATVQRAAKLMDDMYADTKQMHMQAQTEHANQLKDSDPIGYIEQRPDFVKLQSSDKETRKAFLEMVKDDYRAEAQAKVNKMRAEREEWITNAYKRAEQAMDAIKGEGKPVNPAWVDDFLANPDAYFDKHISLLSKKIGAEMDKRASHWWDNALSDPETRYQNSEASLLSLAREMSDEWFTGREVDGELVKSFQQALTSKWADTSRRELRMTNSRQVHGQDVYLLDMFKHDVFGNMADNIADTSGRVAMAKMGWKTEQDIADTLSAMREAGVPTRELEAAKHISDLLLNRAKGLDNNPLVMAASNLTHAAMMGKLSTSILADLPTIIGNLGIGGMTRALGDMAKQVVNGQLFVKNGRKTALGNDLDAYLTGLNGHDHELWIPQQINADGQAMDMSGSILRRSAAAARFTNTLSFANAVSRSIGTAINRTTNQALHKYLRTGKGISDARMADAGLSDALRSRIKAQFDAHGGKADFGLDKWTDPYAKESFISIAHRFTNQNRIDHQSAGELPKWTRDNMLGVLFGRFRTIGIRAQEKILVRNLTMADSNTLAMLTAGLAFTTFLAYGRIYLDAATSKDGAKVLKDRLTPMGIANTVTRLSSVTGLASEGLGLVDLMTGGGVKGGGDTPLTGAIGNITGALGATGQALTGAGDWDKAAAANFKLLPGANTYLLMGLQKAIND